MRGVRLMVLLCALCPTAACGYMDSELSLSDRTYALTFEDEDGELTGEQLLELDEMHISGRYHHSSGCGGLSGTYHFGHHANYRSFKPLIKQGQATRGPVVIVGAGWNTTPTAEEQEAPALQAPTPQELLMAHTTQGSRYFIEHAKANIR